MKNPKNAKAWSAFSALVALVTTSLILQNAQAQVPQACLSGGMASVISASPPVAHVGDTVTISILGVSLGGVACDVIQGQSFVMYPNGNSAFVAGPPTGNGKNGIQMYENNFILNQGTTMLCEPSSSGGAGDVPGCLPVTATYVIRASDINKPLSFTTPRGFTSGLVPGSPDMIKFLAVSDGMVAGSRDGLTAGGQGNAAVHIVTPGISVTKICDSNCFTFGAPITFHGIVCNTGNDVLTNVLVVDIPGATITFLSTTSLGFPFPISGGGLLATNECVDFTGTYQPTNNFCGPFTDTIIASGTDGLGLTSDTNFAAETVFATNSATCSVCSMNPCLTVTKNCTLAQLGQSQTISGAVTNCGNVTLTNVVVSDNILGAVTNVPSLAAGGSFQYSRTFTASVCGTNFDFVTAQGMNPCGAAVQSDATNACVVNCAQTCPPVTNAIVSSFNGTSINTTNFIWFNANFTASGIPAAGATIILNNATIAITSNNGNFSFAVPSAKITFSSSATCATTTFDGTEWVTTVPVSGSDEILLTALGITVPVDLSAANVTFTGSFSADTNGISLNWKWGAAVYTTDMTQAQYNNLGVKPTHTAACLYDNSDHAGTPENVENFVVGGARGGGGSNFTGSWSGTGSVTLCP